MTKLFKTILFLAGILLASQPAAASDNLSCTIKGKIDGVKKGRLYITTRFDEEKNDTLAFCDFKKGKFCVVVPMAEPVVAQITIEGYTGGFTLLAEPSVEYNAFLSNDDRAYIKGGRLNEDYTAHIAASDSMRSIIAALQERYSAMRAANKFRSASLVNDTLKREQQALRNITTSFLASNDNLISAYTIYSNVAMRDMGLREMKSMYDSMGEGAKKSHYGRMLKERIARVEKTVGGAPAPDFTLVDVNGNEVTMSKVPGKIKIIDFWASWCGPCRLNNPALKKLYDEFHSKGLEVIGVSLDNKSANWKAAVEKDGLTWVNVSSLKGWKCDVARLYNVTAVPALFVLDENNNIMATGLRGEQLRAFIAERLNK